MRLTRMFTLALIFAACATIDVSPASADSLCLTNTGHTNSCVSPLAEGTLVRGLTLASSPARFLNESKEAIMECHSTLLGEVDENEGAHKGLRVAISLLSFSNCSGICAGAAGIELPYFALYVVLSLIANLVSGSLGGIPSISLSSCFGFVNCKYKLIGGEAQLGVNADTLVGTNEALVEFGGSAFCPFNTSWDFIYLLTTDNELAKPIYATSLP